MLSVVLPLLVVVLGLAAVAAAVAVALFGRSSRPALFYVIKPPMVVCAFGSVRAFAWCFRVWVRIRLILIRFFDFSSFLHLSLKFMFLCLFHLSAALPYLEFRIL